MPLLNYIQAIQAAIAHEMGKNQSIFILGEDIANYGGAFRLTEDLVNRFGSLRVSDTPVAEAGIIGTAVGACLMGYRPIVEMQFIDFITCGFNQLVNLVSKFHWRFGKPLPLVLRGPYGGFVGGGPFHSQCLEALFLHTNGLKIVAPATPQDAWQLMRDAIYDDDPVLYIEHKSLYRMPKEKVDLNPQASTLGKAIIKRQGSDITVITYGAMVHKSLQAAELLQNHNAIDLEVIDLRTLFPIDLDTIHCSVRKTNKVLIIHEAPQLWGPAGEIIAQVIEWGFNFLDAPIVRVTSRTCPVPYSHPLEQRFLPSVEEIVTAARWLSKY